MVEVGYTQRQAEQVKRSVDRALARVDDDVYLVKNRVPDTASVTGRLDGLLEEIHQVVHDLHEIIERRTCRDST